MHSVEWPPQTPSDFDQMQPLPPPEATGTKKKTVKCDNCNSAQLIPAGRSELNRSAAN